MRRIVVAALGTLTALVLLFSYHTSQNRSGVAVSAVGPPTAGSDAASDAAAAASGKKKPAAKGKTYTGTAVDTRYGVVQVAITVSKKKKITAAKAVKYPTGSPRHEEVNSKALPLLAEAVVDEQGTDIDAVSGATVTSEGYVESLQAAIDAARL